MNITRYILTAVDYGETCDGKARVLGVYKRQEQAHGAMEYDVRVVASNIYEDAKDAENMTVIYADSASVGQVDEHGCEWNITRVEIEVTDDELDEKEGDGCHSIPEDSKVEECVRCSPFSKINVTAQVEWEVDGGDVGPDREVRMDIAAYPDLFSAEVIDNSDPLNWRIDLGALRLFLEDELSVRTGFLHKGFTYDFTPVP